MNNEEWHQWRRGGIGSSDAAVIMGVSPWRTPKQLWEEKVHGSGAQLDNSAMMRGRELEPVARTWFENTMNVTVFPQNKMHAENNWIRASLDGIDLENKILVEIKCPNKDDHATAMGKKVPEKYWPQVQHQLLVTGLDGMYYVSFNGSDGAIVEVARDNDYIASLLEEEQKFWDLVLSKKAPELTDRDFVSMTKNRTWGNLEMRWLENKEVLDMAEKLDKELRASMIECSGNRNAHGNGVRISKSMCPGLIDYKKVMADHPNIDWESYRKNSFEKWNFRGTSEIK